MPFPSTKAETLIYLKRTLKNSVVEDAFVFTLPDWHSNPNGTLDSIQTAFPHQLVIVRSSTIDEDNIQSFKAGYFHTESDVFTGSGDALTTAIDRVIHSYSRNGRVANQHDQVLVQPCIRDTAFSGVVLTRDPRLNTPYYVINYDSSDRSTSSVTRGLSSSLIRLIRWVDTSTLEGPWAKLVLAIQELERIYGKEALDVEFAVDSRDNVHIFQVRPLLLSKADVGDEKVKSIVERLEKEFDETSKIHRLAGSNTIFCDMSDWNPAEMIGNRSNVFDYSLYRFLITKSIWNRARVSIGYTDVDPFELMVCFANKPYIDGRISFNSLTPGNLAVCLKKRLIDYYVHKLIDHPDLQDKVEFEVVLNCFELSFDRRIPELRSNGFTKDEIEYLRTSLLAFTDDLLKRSNSIIESALKELEELGRRRSRIMKDALPISTPEELLDRAFDLLADCKQLGTLPFSKLARLAFVGMIILKSMLREGIIGESFFYSFLSSIKTVVTEFRTDLDRLAHGDLSFEAFISQYGHLRPRTYDITALRYDQTPNLFRSPNDSEPRSVLKAKQFAYAADRNMLEKISKTLLESGLHCSGKDFLSFVRKTVQLREYSKFEFTKNISDAIELIALAGLKLGFCREELSMIDIDTVMQSQGSGKFDRRHVRRAWKKVMRENQKKKILYQKIALPPVIDSEKDFTVVQYYVSRPNFVTTKCVEGTVMDLSLIEYERIPDLSDRIVILESADPGYDWIFTHDLKGLITMYGGVASHMAIRCGEFGLPAAIGCGELIFEKVKACKRIRLDCAMENIVPLY